MGKKQPTFFADEMTSIKENRLPPKGKSVLMVMGGSIHHDRIKGTTHKKDTITTERQIPMLHQDFSRNRTHFLILANTERY